MKVSWKMSSVLDHHADIIAHAAAVAFDKSGYGIPVARKVAVEQYLVALYWHVHTLLLIGCKE